MARIIKFGTSGWRGIIADDFTFSNVRLVTQAICDYVQAREKSREVIIGYDTRFLSEDFARVSAEVLAGNGIKTLLCKRDTPTPVIAFEILRRKAAGGINFTASHNPPDYNGLKFSPGWGGPALPETTAAIEAACSSYTPDQVKTLPLSEAIKQKLVQYIDPRPQYLKRLRELVDFKAIKKGNLKVAVDDLYGTAIGYLDDTLASCGVRQTVIHNYRDVLFGGHSPEPSEENLKELFGIMKKQSCRLGLACDGDADRFGIIDSDGTFITPNETVAVLFYYLVTVKGWSGVAARSVMTTGLIDRIAEKYGIEVRETPVGFKYIGEIAVKEGDNFIIGGEESGGLTIRGHVPEKDGILVCLLVTEMVASTGKSIRRMLEEIYSITGRIFTKRLNFHLTHEGMEKFRRRLHANPPSKIAGLKITNTITIDGYKFILSDGSWLGVRLSGTEPVVRLYLETNSAPKMKKLISAGKKFIQSPD